MRGTMGGAGTGVGALLLLGASLIVPQIIGPTGAAAAATAHVAVSPSPTPAFVPPACGTGTPAYNYEGSGDAADPQVVYSGGTYYAFTTGNALGNNIAALVSSSPNSGYGPYTHECYGSTALPSPSPWEQPNTQTSPGVFQYGGHWVMFYDAAQSGHASDSGFDCLAVATATSISATDAQFGDVSDGPIECQPTGSIDPEPFVDPSTGIAYLVWKQNDGGSSAPAYIWAEQLNSSGTGFAPGSSPSLLLTNNTVSYPWETTVEDPSMEAAGGGFYLAFSAGDYTSTSYSEAITACSGPLGPCGSQSQVLTTYGSVLGSGRRCALLRRRRKLVARLCGMAGRFARVHQLRVRRRATTLCRPDRPAQWQRTSSLQRAGIGVRVLHGRLGRRHFHLRRSPVLRLGGGAVPEQAGGWDGRHP